MAKKNHKVRNQRHKAASLGKLSPNALLEKGNLFLRQEKYQDAILTFKELLKQDENPENLQALLQAYLGRIESLAAKSMIKEALAMLETVVHRWPDAGVEPLKLSLLLQAGSFAEAVRLYARCGRQLASDRLERLEALFGALLLAGTGGLRPEDFAGDSPVARHYPAALAACDAVFAGEEAKAQEALKQISFRSPYRDLRTLLTGFLQFPRDKDKACVFFAKIDKDSPYFHSAARYLATTDTPEIFLQKLTAVAKHERPQIRLRHGLNPAQFQALEDLAKSDGKPLGLLHLVRRHESCFQKKDRLKLLKDILPFCHDQVVTILNRNTDFNRLEQCRICALAAEKDDALTFAVDFWSDYLGKSGQWDPPGHKEIALVLRRQAKLKQRESHYYSAEEVLDTMVKSLKYDPDHAGTWLDASDFAKRNDLMARHYAIIQDAVAKLPENVEILVAAMKASGTKGAHKKAAGLAQRILAIDPINTSALDLLVESRLEHGRKLALQKKWALAEKELQSADTRVKAIRYRGRNRMCLGMLLLLQGREDGLPHIAAGRRENGLPLLSYVLTSLEAKLYKLPYSRIKVFDRELCQVAKEIVVDRAEFLRLITWLLTFPGRQWQMLKEVCKSLTNLFARAATLEWSRDEGLSICRALGQADLLAALAKFTVALQKKYPENLEFRVWHLIAAFSKKKNKQLPRKVQREIEDLLDEMDKKGHFDLADRLDELLEDDVDDDFPSYLDAIEDIFNNGPFGLPKILRDESKPQPKKKPKTGRQLHLFDDEIE
jgi:tetratricopeptide (TPR) repeat protein